ncbi:metalloprotease TldD [Kordiimonas sp. SCSIO 12603]|uniref:metalloprotease TldD n=1 Tax=Kordiimonas sp. SCSIO 12603 TaxID=2829596 RepID=UPI002102E30C|nr:metalloprotease TldD [Kordiimonas sp. SCSIO 12603]UTW58193.1 metalloprotease TldD [Kordiimonas sp. SCSIO 12603]
MTDAPASLNFFFEQSELDEKRTESLVSEALSGMDDGEIYLESTQSESFSYDDGRLKAASFDSSQGFGLRAVADESTGYAHSNELSEAAIKRAANTVRAVKSGHDGSMSLAPARTNKQLYTDENPLGGISFDRKVKLLEEIDEYARAQDDRIRQVSASILGSWQAVEIIRADGHRVRDIRPLVRLNVSVVLGEGDRQEAGNEGAGGRQSYDFLFDEAHWQAQVNEAIRQANVNLESVDAPAGEMTVVLGPGWPGVLLHEAVGHGLEGDFNRKKTSAFAGLMGERVAAPGITVVDDGTIDSRRGSLSVDDEGTPTERTVLIEDGILKGYMQDRLNARLMGMTPTGNGRRQSFAHAPMPRMTNTFMMAGDKDPAEILASVDDGLYAVNFGGGQVDITSGKFVFSCTEAYRVRGGKIAEPVKGATLIGSGPEVLKHVSMIGNDLKLDNGVGTCGKGGQTVPAGVGQPTLKIDGLTVGGTAG